MSLEILVYSFEDADGDQETDWTTTDYSEAKRYARDNECRLVENTYHWYDSVTVEDYCREDEDDTIQEHIDNGVRVLNEHFGDSSVWANRVPVENIYDLDIDSPSNCVLHHIFKAEPLLTDDERTLYGGGQAFYMFGIDRLNLASDDAGDYGFCSNDNEGELLTDMWRTTIFQLQTVD